MYLSFMVSHVEIQLEIYKWTNSVGSSTAVVSRFTTYKENKRIFHLNNVYSQEFTISKTDHLAYEVRDLNKVGDFFLNI